MSRKVMIEVDDNDIDDFVERGIVRAEVARNAVLITESDDAVSRQAVNDLYDRYHPTLATCVYEFGEELKALPSVNPTRAHGKWIQKEYWSEGCGMGETYGYYYECSKCGNLKKGGYDRCGVNYCPNCGADMRLNEVKNV